MHSTRPGRRVADLAAALVLLGGGCASYEPDPAEPLEILRGLRAIRVAGLDARGLEVAPLGSQVRAADGLTVLEAAAVAVGLNPRVRAQAAEVGVAGAQLVEAGLLPDVSIGWDAMDAIADAALLDGDVESPSWLAGASLSWPVPRPGELDAREGVASARLSAARAQVLRAEWVLVRDVHLAYLELLVADAALDQLERLARVAARSLDHFERARRAGAATALDETLSRVAVEIVRAERLRAEARRTQARLALNALLGLPPEARFALQTSLDELTTLAAGVASPVGEQAAALVATALARRPDVAQVLAEYEQAEEALRLEVAQQWPQLTIGTGIGLQLPIFSGFNQAGVQRALATRAAAKARVVVAVQEVRREVHAALAAARQAARLLAHYRERLAPEVAASLALTERAFEAREVTPLEILTAQRQVIETQTEHLAARQRWAAARVRLEAAAGRLLGPWRPVPETEVPQPDGPDREGDEK